MNLTTNIEYKSDALAAFYRTHRVRWDQFYESERVVFAELGLGPQSAVLDLGCGCGGLGLAFRERFGLSDYTGVEINRQAAEAARVLNPHGRFLTADILAPPEGELREAAFDLVVSLSCIDWNVRFTDMLTQAWRYVKPGGYLVASFRLTTEKSVTDIKESWQHINFDGKKEGEAAPYVVLNFAEMRQALLALAPGRIRGYGYWGAPSASAVTPYGRIVFAVMAVQKRTAGAEHTQWILDLPPELLASIPR